MKTEKAIATTGKNTTLLVGRYSLDEKYIKVSMLLPCGFYTFSIFPHCSVDQASSSVRISFSHSNSCGKYTQDLQTLLGYTIDILKCLTAKLYNFINFGLLFTAGAMYSRSFLKSEIC